MNRLLNKRESNIFVLCIVVVLVYLGNHYAINPLRKMISSVDISIKKAKNKLLYNLGTIEDQKQYKSQYVKYLSKFQQEQNNDEVMSSILSEIQQIGETLNLKISDLKPKKVQKERYFNRFSINLAIDSTFVDVISFIYKLQSKPYLFKVEEFRFDKSPRTNERTIKTYLVLSKVLVPKDN